MSHPKNTTAPPEAQQTTFKSPRGGIAGFEYWEVRVRYEEEGLTSVFPGVLDEDLAYEFVDILRPEVSPGVVSVIWAGGLGCDYAFFKARSDRVSDLIISVRTAERPGHEYLARIGQFGPCVGYATQNSDCENVSRRVGGMPE